mgnify:CR=1 FL=1
MRLNNAFFWAGLIAISATFITSVWQKEELKENGITLHLPLNDRPGRQVIYGDVIKLTLNKASRPSEALLQVMPVSGQIIFTRGANNIGHYQRLHQGGAVAENEVLLSYHIKGQDFGRPQIIYCPDYIPYNPMDLEAILAARYAVYKVGKGGQSLVIGLADQNGQFISLKALN